MPSPLLLFFGWLAPNEATAQIAKNDKPLRSFALAATPEADIPAYVSAASPGWIIGFELRSRWEDRSGRLRDRPDPAELTLGLTRARVSLGFAPEQSSFRFSLEAQDARQLGSDFPETPLTVNELDLLQLRIRFDLDPVLHVPMAVEAGRISFDALDRRLIARNRFRNTTNAFEGVRVRIGRTPSPIALEVLALWPTQLRAESLDKLDENRRLFGTIGSIHRPQLVLEPYYLFYDANTDRRNTFHTTGVHLFGPIGDRWDHDLHAAFQLGSLGEDAHRAFAFHGELGRRFESAWAPRISAWLNYASGDAEPDDSRSGRFDPLFGASHTMYGFTDLMSWQNTINPVVSLTLSPSSRFELELMHRLYWLASAKDAFVRAALRDPEGDSGTFIGQELDVELRWDLLPFAELNVQYGELFAGGFVKRTGGGTGARVFYVALTVSAP
ncbi:MAG TPA: alginate export family protein [Vicinamibacteria bacterium]|nr:alginate export family protein [Vicinamibacteria bacterium]